MNNVFSVVTAVSKKDLDVAGKKSITDIGNEDSIRFEWKRNCYVWVPYDNIMIVISSDHYVKSLIKCRKQHKWMNRHCTIKELLAILPHAGFIRLNKFYLLNRNHFSHINETEKKLYFTDNFSFVVEHRISTFILSIIK